MTDTKELYTQAIMNVEVIPTQADDDLTPKEYNLKQKNARYKDDEAFRKHRIEYALNRYYEKKLKDQTESLASVGKQETPTNDDEPQLQPKKRGRKSKNIVHVCSACGHHDSDSSLYIELQPVAVCESA
jgi:hypothetical protein